MADNQVIAVLGIESQVGEAVAKTLAKFADVKVRALVSDVTSTCASNLKNLGVEIVACSMKDMDEITSALEGALKCFIVTETDIAQAYCVENEIELGRILADACTAANMDHVVYCTQIHTQRVKGIQVRPWVTKAEIEDYMKEKNLPLSCIMVPLLYQDFVNVLKPEKVQNNTFQLEIPMGLTPLDLINVDDIGGIVKHIFDNKASHLNKTICVSGDKLTTAEVAAILNVTLKPKMFREKQISINDYREKDFPGSKDWANMFNFLLRVDTKYNVTLTKTMDSNVRSFQQWVKEERDWILSRISS